MFEFSILGLILLVAGAAYLLLVGRHFIPERIEALKAGEMVKIAIRVPYYAKEEGGHEKRDPRTPSDPEQHNPEEDAAGPASDRSAEDDEVDAAPAELH